MRITNGMLVSNFLTNMNSSMARMYQYDMQLSSQRKIVRISDDSVGVLNSMSARQNIYSVSQYRENVSAALTWVDQNDTVLQQLSGLLTEIRANLVDATADYKSATDKEAIGKLIRQYEDQIMDMGNSSIGGNYIFGGYNITTKPFARVTEKIKDYSAEFGPQTDPLPGGVTLPASSSISITGITDVRLGNESGKDYKINYAMNDPADPAAGGIFYLTTLDEKGDNVTVLKEAQFTKVSETESVIDFGLYGQITLTDNNTPPSTPAVGIDEAAAGYMLSGGEISIQTEKVDNGKVLYNGVDLTDVSDKNMKMIDKLRADVMRFEVGHEVYQDVTVNGVDFIGVGDNNIFNIMDQIVNDLMNDAPAQKLTGYLADIDRLQEMVLKNSVTVGASQVKLETMENRYSADALNYESTRSDIEDIDVAETIMRMKMAEMIYKQALSVGARIIQPTLLDFLN